MAGTVLLSPHPDDIAYSLGGSILTGFYPPPMRIITIFTRGSLAPRRSDLTDVDRISKIRALEDYEYGREIKVRIQRLHFAESSLRDTPSPPGRDPIYNVVKEYLSAKLHGLKDSLILCPLGLGGDIDHLIVRNICDDLGFSYICYYEDLPYVNRISIEVIDAFAARLSLKPCYIQVDPVMDPKIRNLLIYASQVGISEILEVINHAKRLGIHSKSGGYQERIWYKKASSFQVLSEDFSTST